MTSDISTKEAAIKEYEAMIAQENAEIAALENARFQSVAESIEAARKSFEIYRPTP